MKRFFTAAVAVLLVVIFCTVTVLAALIGEERAPISALSFGIAGRENNVTVDGAALYSSLFGERPTETTAKYLNANGLTLCYNDAISAGCVSTDYRAETGELSITVRPYTYTAENGATVTWIPRGASVEGEAISLTQEDGVYVARMEGLFRSENFNMSVDFSWSVEIPAEVTDEIRNEAYRVGEQALSEQAAYDVAYEEYARISADYIAWQTYLEKKAAYEAYAEALAEYNSQVAAYDTYVKAKERFDAEDAAYTKWQAYYVKLDEYTEQYEDYIAYETYLVSLATAERKVSLLESIFLSDSHGWQMYSSIMGSTVSRVIDNKDELVNVLHCNAEDVDLARKSTEELRVLLKGYKEIRSASYSSSYEKTKAKYEYFEANYDAFLLHFTNLYKTLKGFLSNTFVERAMEMEGQREHYLQFVGQLYVISTCLDSEGERRADWSVGGKRLEEVVESKQLLPDGDWDPRTTAFPSRVSRVECPTPPTQPTVAMPSQKPVAPKPVAPPPATAPTPVENPDDGVIPPRCDEAPMTEPIAPTFDALTQALMKEISDGVLVKRDKETAAKTLSFTSSLARPVSILNEKVVTFYNIDGSLLNRVLVSYGGAISYAPPEHAPSPAYEYRLLGWVSAEGRDVDLRFITTDLDLYPSYEITKKSYTVTWRVIGVDGTASEFSSIWTYGTLPAPGATVPCFSYEENGYVYTFSGWDREILPVTEHVTYTGTMTKTPKKYTVTWVIGDKSVSEEWDYGTLPSFEGDTALTSPSYSYQFLGWAPAIGIVEGDATYVARYEIHPFATSGTTALEVVEDAQSMTVLAQSHSSVNVKEMMERAQDAEKTLSVRWENGCELVLDTASLASLSDADCSRIVLQTFEENGDTVFELHFYNSLLKNVSIKGAAPILYLPQSTEADGRTAAFFLSDEEGVETRIEGDALFLSGFASIRRCFVYPITVTPDPNCNTGVLGYDAEPGTSVSLRLNCLVGYAVMGATVTDAEGNAIEVTDLSFVMPSSRVHIDLKVEKIVYHVIFRSEGKVISAHRYQYGEAIVLPEAPQKASVGEKVYTFVSWGSEVPTHAVGDVWEMVFDAVFSEQVKDIDYDTGHNNNLLAEVILPVAGGCILLIICLIVFAVKWRRKRKRG